jgi:1-acyl-sn-glycerol-3-phosphate acyltransferase
MDQLTPHLPRSGTRAFLRLAALIALAVMMFIPVLMLYLMRLERVRAFVVRFFYDMARRISGVRLQVEGELSGLRPLMLVANHSSYLDVFVLGSLLPISFTPKLEIRSWPVIGFFCVLADCVFIERRPADMQRAQAEMEEKLRAGKVLVLFPEGTTGDGYHVKPFKSGFLSLVEAHDLPLQPVVIAYTHIGSVPLSAATRDQVAWIGEASFVTHFMRLLRFPYIQVTARFFDVERRDDHDDRKALAKSCEATIAEGLHKMLEARGVTG